MQIRENLVLVEQVVADRHLREQVALLEGILLPVPRQQVEELGLKGGASAARAVRLGAKWIVCVVEHEPGVESRAQPFRQDGLPKAWGALDGKVADVQDGAQYSGPLHGRASDAHASIRH